VQVTIISNASVKLCLFLVSRMSQACLKKCIPPRYKENELSKGEAVCLDRCVAKYMEVHDKVGKKLTSMSTQDEEAIKKLQASMQPPAK
jgi:import inner membrane translocase subunit TIM10